MYSEVSSKDITAILGRIQNYKENIEKIVSRKTTLNNIRVIIVQLRDNGSKMNEMMPSIIKSAKIMLQSCYDYEQVEELMHNFFGKYYSNIGINNKETNNNSENKSQELEGKKMVLSNGLYTETKQN